MCLSVSLSVYVSTCLCFAADVTVYLNICIFVSRVIRRFWESLVDQSVLLSCLGREMLHFNVDFSESPILYILIPWYAILFHSIPLYHILSGLSYPFLFRPIISYLITCNCTWPFLHRDNSQPLFLLVGTFLDVECSPYESEASSGTLLVSARLYIIHANAPH